MSEMIIYDEQHEEKESLTSEAKRINAYISDTRLDVSAYDDGNECISALSGGARADMAVSTVGDDGDTSVPEGIRTANDYTSIMLVADAKVSPMRYLTPKIRACSLLLRPYNDSLRRSVMKDFMTYYYRKSESEEDEVLILENFGEKKRIPISQIYYIEARGKKVFVRLRSVEYSEYATFEKVLEQLGERFVRCHRSFAFNRAYFDSAKLSENRVNLLHGFSVPLSRSYKGRIREFINDIR